jgi:hypothetical protein
VKAMIFGNVPALGGLLILIMATTIGCADRERPANPSSVPDSGASAIFEKGKTYSIITSAMPTESKFTVVDIGPPPWLKVKSQKGGEFWINTTARHRLKKPVRFRR